MISIVIPAYNEQKRLPRSIEDLKSFFCKLNLEIEVIIVVEKSKDDTLKIAKELTENNKMFKILANDVHRGPRFCY